MPQSGEYLRDVYVIFETKVLNPDVPLKDQGVGEGSVLRINVRLRGGAPSKNCGQPG